MAKKSKKALPNPLLVRDCYAYNLLISSMEFKLTSDKFYYWHHEALKMATNESVHNWRFSPVGASHLKVSICGGIVIYLL